MTDKDAALAEGDAAPPNETDKALCVAWYERVLEFNPLTPGDIRRLVQAGDKLAERLAAVERAAIPPQPLTDEDIDEITEAIENFVIGPVENEELRALWQPSIDKLNALKRGAALPPPPERLAVRFKHPHEAVGTTVGPQTEAQERLEATTGQLLIELAFLLPEGTNVMEHPIAKKLIAFRDAVRGAALPPQPDVWARLLWLADRVQAQNSQLWPSADNPYTLSHDRLTCTDPEHFGCHKYALIETLRAALPPAPAPRFAFEAWEGADYVVTMNGKPIGQTLSKSQAHAVSRWLPTAIAELRVAEASALARPRQTEQAEKET